MEATREATSGAKRPAEPDVAGPDGARPAPRTTALAALVALAEAAVRAGVEALPERDARGRTVYVRRDRTTLVREPFAVGDDLLLSCLLRSPLAGDAVRSAVEKILSSGSFPSRLAGRLVADAIPDALEGFHAYTFGGGEAVAVLGKRGVDCYFRDGAKADALRARAEADPCIAVHGWGALPEGLAASRCSAAPLAACGRWRVEDPHAKDFEAMGISWEGEPTLVHRILDDQRIAPWAQFALTALIGRTVAWGRDSMKTFVSIVGESNTGKSVVARIIEVLMGAEHVAYLEANGRGQFNFDKALDAAAIVFLEGAALVDGDVDRNALLKLTAQEPVTFNNVKRGTSVQLEGRRLAKTVFSFSNGNILFEEINGVFPDRPLLLRFKVPIAPDRRDPALLDKVAASAGEIFLACTTAYYALLELLRGRVPADLYPESYRSGVRPGAAAAS